MEKSRIAEDEGGGENGKRMHGDRMNGEIPGEMPGANVFVFGGLRAHMGNHRLLAGSPRLAAQCWTAGRLYDTGWGFPAMLPAAEEKVYGDLYRVDAATLARLDAFEGYKGIGRDNDCDRIVQPVHTDRGSVAAYLYAYATKRADGLRRIGLGDWKYDRLRPAGKPIVYFAYGSCMDDARFRQRGAAHLFRDVLGRGELDGYALRFTRQARDGGRADLAEEGGRVEGKAYRIGEQALQELLRREGVDRGIYRPAFVDIRVDGRIVRDALTFLVVQKAKRETAPSPSYLAEIRRGGSTVWSAGYAREFEANVGRLPARR